MLGSFSDKVAGLQVVNVIKRRTPSEVISCVFLRNFQAYLFHRTPLLVFVSEFWDVLQDTFFIEHFWKTTYLCTSWRISSSIYSSFQSLRLKGIAIRRCSFNQNLWKLSVKKSIRSEFVRSQASSLWKKNFSHIPLYVFYPHILRTHHNYFFWRGFEIVQELFLLENIDEK